MKKGITALMALRLLLLSGCATLAPSPTVTPALTATPVPPLTTSIDDVIGTWQVVGSPFTFHQLNADGTYRLASGPLTNLEDGPQELGRFTLEGGLLTFLTSDDSLLCAGQSGTYEARLSEQGWLSFSLREDQCGFRARHVDRWVLQPFSQGSTYPARAIILFIGDGMGIAQRTAATWSELGLDGTLVMDAMPASGWSHTNSADQPITDSAAAGTAIATGFKTDNGRVSVDPGGNPLTTILERAQSIGMAVGLVTTTQMAHATPATFAAHVPDRGMMTEIASQMVSTGVDVLLGGGEDEFLPISTPGCHSEPGERNDGRNLIAESVSLGYAYVCDAAGLAAIDIGSTSRLLGLFADEGMIRPYSPSLATMTQVAIEILSRDPDGFFLMVEGGQIDWSAHDNDAVNMIQDTIDLDEAVAVGQAYAEVHPDTLIIVTADHETGGMGQGLGSSGTSGEDGPFLMPDGTLFLVNWSTASHTGMDVPTSAQGPWADLLNGTYENTQIHTVMHAALGGASFTDVLPNHWSLPFVETRCQVNECVVRLGVMQGEFHWHKHDEEDEFFFVLEGRFLIDLKEETITLDHHQGYTIPRGVLHRTRAPERSVILMVEQRSVKPTGDE